MLKFRVDGGDHLVKEHLENTQNTMYTSNTIQNKINIVAELVRKRIADEVNCASKVFAVTVDASKDCSNKE